MKIKYSFLIFCLFIILFLGCISFSQPEYKKIDKSYREYIQGNDEKFFEILEAFKRGNEYSGKAAILLGKMMDKRATQSLCAELLRDGPYAQESLNALGLILDKRSVPILVRVVKENRPYSPKTVEILGNLKDNRAVPALIQVINERRPYYLTAFSALGNIGDKSVLSYALEFLEKPTPEEPQDVMLKVIHKGKDDPSWKYSRIFKYSGKNIPPRVKIMDYNINPLGIVWIGYQLFDNELDTLNIIPEISQDGGNTWSPATMEGITTNITSKNYEGELYWRTDKDNITYSPQTKLIFKLTPKEKFASRQEGVYDIIPIDINYNKIDMANISGEVGGNVTFSVYYPAETPQTGEIFNYLYSINRGKNWLHATAQRLTKGTVISPDTEQVVWKSEEDLLGFDSENVSFLVSLSGGKVLGKWDATNPFHLDNNKPPSLNIFSINDAEFLEIEYQITDNEKDTIGLIPEFSRDGGVSWERATISGNINKITSENYHGILKWYSDFDIPQIKEIPLRIRLTPYDNDNGPITETRDFFLKSSYYAKPVSGLTKNDIFLTYYNTISDSTTPVIQYSTDNGKTWKNATAKSIYSIGYQDRYTNVINWETKEDIIFTDNRMNVFTNVFNQIGDPSVVPELLIISRQKDSPSYLEKRNAIQAIKILDQKPKWVIEGLINSLLNESAIIRITAEDYLRSIDEPRVVNALQAYDNYWTEVRRTQIEISSSETESKYYAQELENLKKYIPTQSEISNFLKNQLKARGVKEERANEFLSQLQLFKFEKQLKTQLQSGQITQEEYNSLLREEIKKLEVEILKK